MSQSDIFEKEEIVNEVVEPEPQSEPVPKAKKPRKKREGSIKL